MIQDFVIYLKLLHIGPENLDNNISHIPPLFSCKGAKIFVSEET